MKKLFSILLVFCLISCSSSKNTITLKKYYKNNKISYNIDIDAFLNKNGYLVDKNGFLINGNVRRSERGKYVIIGDVRKGILSNTVDKKYVFLDEINTFLKKEKVNFTLGKNAFYKNGKILDRNDRIITGFVYMNATEKISNFTLIASVINGKYSGVLMEFINNKPKTKEIYSNGKLDGKGEYYFENNYLKMTAEYKNGVKNGKVVKYYSGDKLYGKVLSEATFKNGYMDGKEIEYYPSGVKKYEANYVKDMLNGQYIVYNKNASVDKIFTFIMGKAHGESLVFYPNSKEILMRTNYLRGKINGKEIYYYPNGNLAVETTYKNNKISSPVIVYWPNGSRKLVISDMLNKTGFCYDDGGNKYRDLTNIEKRNYVNGNNLFKLATSPVCADKK